MWKELYAIVIVVHTWGPKKILFHCDNKAVVDIWEKGSTKAPETMALVVRLLYFLQGIHQFPDPTDDSMLELVCQGIRHQQGGRPSKSMATHYHQSLMHIEELTTSVPVFTLRATNAVGIIYTSVL